MMFEYYLVVLHDGGTAGMIYHTEFSLNTKQGLLEMTELLKNDGFSNPVIMYIRELQEKEEL